MRNSAETNPRRISRRSLFGLGVGLATAVGLTIVGIGCGDGGSDTPTSPTANVLKTESPMPSATAMATQILESPTQTIAPSPEPSPTATEVSKAPVNCEILPQEYCSQGKLIDWTNSLGVQWKLVTFNLGAGTPIYAPFDGSLFQTEGPGNLISPNAPGLSIYNPDNSAAPVFILTGDIKLNGQQYTVRKGDIIAYTQNTGIKVFDSTIALTVTVADSTTNSIKTDEDLLRQNFPNLFKE